MVLPLYILLLGSIKPFEEMSLASMWNLPTKVQLRNYAEAFLALRSNVLNSFVLVIPTTLASAILGAWNGYVLSKWRFRGSELVFGLILFGMFIPYQSILIPLVQILRKMHLYGSIAGLAFTHVVYGIPLMAMIFRNFYARVPQEIVEAGRIDGSGLFGIFTSIMLPLSWPAFVVAVVWQFTSVWNEFLFAIIVTQDPTVQPVTVAFVNLAGCQYTEWNVQMAGAILVSLPTLILYVVLGKYYIRGILAGSVKA
jgi:glucose/mannose transport system permease protein